MCRVIAVLAAIVVTLLSNVDSLIAWGGQGHRLVGLIAAERLTPAARQQVRTLLDGQTLADVASWADSITGEQVQTSYWHYLNIPPDARGYDRDRDCPRQPGVEAGSRSDRLRPMKTARSPVKEAGVGVAVANVMQSPNSGW